MRSTDKDRLDALELFALRIYPCLVLAALKRDLTPEEAEILQRSAELTGGNAIESQIQETPQTSPDAHH
jgi:hypothetical protein